MEYNAFIGIGANPDGPDLPSGLGTELAQNPNALNTFGRMTKEEKTTIIRHIQEATTGDEAKTRIVETINQLNHGQTSF